MAAPCWGKRSISDRSASGWETGGSASPVGIRRQPVRRQRYSCIPPPILDFSSLREGSASLPAAIAPARKNSSAGTKALPWGAISRKKRLAISRREALRFKERLGEKKRFGGNGCLQRKRFLPNELPARSASSFSAFRERSAPSIWPLSLKRFVGTVSRKEALPRPPVRPLAQRKSPRWGGLRDGLGTAG